MAALRAASYILEEAKEAAQLEDRYFAITDRQGGVSVRCTSQQHHSCEGILDAGL
jgi:hypothetical protein